MASADCLDGTLLSVLGQGVYFKAGAVDVVDPVDAVVLWAAEGMNVPGGLTLFLRSDTAETHRDRLVRYLDQLDPSVRAETSLAVLDPNGRVVTDPAQLRGFADLYDLPVHAPLGVEPHGSLVPVDPVGRATAEQPVAYRVLPGAAAAQRLALQAAHATQVDHDPTVAEGMSNLTSWLAATDQIRDRLGIAPSAADAVPPRAAGHAPEYALGAYLARFGSAVNVFDLLQNTGPMLADRVAEVIGGEFGRVESSVLAAVLRGMPGSAALVRGAEDLFWLVSDADGVLGWVDPRAAGRVLPFDIDGGRDWRTAVLERGAEVLVVDAERRPVELPAPVARPRPPAASIVLPTGVRVGDGGELLVGAWPPENRAKYGLTDVELAGLPVVAVDVRRVRGKLMDPVQLNALKHVLERYRLNGVRPVVVATAGEQGIVELVERYGGVLIHRSPTSLGFEWRLAPPDGAVAEHFEGGVLTQRVFDRAGAALDALDAPPGPVPAPLIELLSFNTYRDAGRHFQDNLAALRAPAVIEAMHDLAATFPQDRRLQAFDLAMRIAQRAPFLAGDAPLEPTVRNSLDPESALPAQRPIDLAFVFDYLTARDLAPVGEGALPPGPYQTRLLWDGLLFQALLGRKLTTQETIVLARAVGEDDAGRAARLPDTPETARAHASIFAAIGALVDRGLARRNARPDGRETVEVDWMGLLDVKNCLTGEDRVPWHFRIKDVLTPHLQQQQLIDVDPGLLGDIAELKAQINVCY